MTAQRAWNPQAVTRYIATASIVPVGALLFTGLELGIYSRPEAAPNLVTDVAWALCAISFAPGILRIAVFSVTANATALVRLRLPVMMQIAATSATLS